MGGNSVEYTLLLETCWETHTHALECWGHAGELQALQEVSLLQGWDLVNSYIQTEHVGGTSQVWKVLRSASGFLYSASLAGDQKG